jgi:gas vesicle protein
MRDTDLGFFLVGIVCGAAVGLVFAPMRGGELRRKLADEADEGLRVGRAAIERGREARSVAADAREVAQRARELSRPL